MEKRNELVQHFPAGGMFTAFVNISFENKRFINERLPALNLELLEMCQETDELMMLLP